MKKIYSLLLLGGLLLFGAGNVFADDTYVVAGNIELLEESWNGSSTATVMTDNGEGYYTFTKTVFLNTSGTYQFKVVKNGSSWIPDGDNLSVSTTSNGWYDVTFRYKKDGGTIDYTKVASTSTYSVTINLTGIAANTAHLHSFVNWGASGSAALGSWPGQDANASNQWTVEVLSGRTLGIVFNDGEESGTKSADINVGTIASSGKTFTYNIDSNYKFWSLRGQFNDWTDANQSSSNQIIINLDANLTDKQFKIYNGEWYGVTGTQAIAAGTPKALDSKENTAKNLTISTGATGGDFLFATSWSATGYPTLTVFYPGDIYSRDDVDAGAWGTICLPFAATLLSESGDADVQFYSISGPRTVDEDKFIVLEEVSGPLSAGVPYIYHVNTAGDLRLSYGTSAAVSGSHNGLIGTYVSKTVETGKYVIYDDGTGAKVRKVNGANVTCGANKAYIDMEVVNALPAAAPGLGRLEMPLAPETATGFDAIEAKEKAVKFFEDGQLLIRKDGVVYDMTGRIVK